MSEGIWTMTDSEFNEALREAKEQAWDQGWDAFADFDHRQAGPFPSNPCRSQQ